jgi:hypothetical protein
MPNLYLKNIHPMGHKHKPNPDSLKKSTEHAPLKPPGEYRSSSELGGIPSYVRCRGAVPAPLLFPKIGIEPLNCYNGMAVLLLHFGRTQAV